MSRKKPPQVKEDVTCNLIPMIDIMFLLLLFFMLSADMTQREFEDVVLPSADQVQEADEKKTAGEVLTTLNIFHRPDSATFTCPLFAHGSLCRDQAHWLIGVRSQEFTRDTIRDQIKVEAEESLEPDVDPATNKRMSARKVIIRADQMAPYGDVQKVMQYCGEFGIYKIEVAAAAPISE
jgi:biopolymer transport protein ExbD